MSKDAKPTDNVELRPDGEERFRQAVRIAGKSGPKHRPKAEPGKPKGERLIHGYPESYYENDAGLDPDRKPAPLSKEAAADLDAYLEGLKTDPKDDD